MPSSSTDFIHLCLRPYHNLPKHREDPGYCCVGSTREDCSDKGVPAVASVSSHIPLAVATDIGGGEWPRVAPSGLEMQDEYMYPGCRFSM